MSSTFDTGPRMLTQYEYLWSSLMPILPHKSSYTDEQADKKGGAESKVAGTNGESSPRTSKKPRIPVREMREPGTVNREHMLSALLSLRVADAASVLRQRNLTLHVQSQAEPAQQPTDSPGYPLEQSREGVNEVQRKRRRTCPSKRRKVPPNEHH
ncbi:hypothetical protein B0H13DRAFT_2338755 [Mycena leptocephala]|nr:hypothetical protein B0H13DRAFT_2338755 [Mycena leptocephala]